MFSAAFNFDCDLSGWDVSNVRHMQAMFRDTAMDSVDLSKWDVRKVKNHNSMFERCPMETRPDLWPNFND
jgi:hypothetical protein